MLKLKSHLTCTYCTRIFKHPIILPCDHSLCGQHLNERDVVKQNTIKCKACSEEFAVKGNDFKSNEAFARSIESQSHLSGEEIGLKQS